QHSDATERHHPGRSDDRTVRRTNRMPWGPIASSEVLQPPTLPAMDATTIARACRGRSRVPEFVMVSLPDPTLRHGLGTGRGWGGERPSPRVGPAGTSRRYPSDNWRQHASIAEGL